MSAAFGRLCVETDVLAQIDSYLKDQPPSGGCVLKQIQRAVIYQTLKSAAFGRLCVETCFGLFTTRQINSAAFGRLCVET